MSEYHQSLIIVNNMAKGNRRGVCYVLDHKMDRATERECSARVNRAYERFLCQPLGLTENAKRLLGMQSVQGQARSGHGVFSGSEELSSGRALRYPNMTIEDIIELLDFDVVRVKKQRDGLVRSVFQYLYRVFVEARRVFSNDKNGRVLLPLLDEDGAPLLGIERFRKLGLVDGLEVCRGIFLASCLDNYSRWRSSVEKEYGVVLGGGECVAVRMRGLRKNGLTLEDLSRKEHNRVDLLRLYRQGTICLDEVVRADRDIISGYVRLRKGCGVSDDLAVIMGAVMFPQRGRYNLPRSYGILIGDGVDTWDKCLPEIYRGGHDEALGRKVIQKFAELEKRFKSSKNEQQFSLNISADDARRFIYSARIDPERRNYYPDSSQRYFAKLVCRDSTVVDEHLHFVERFEREAHTPVEQAGPKFKIGFGAVPARRFYAETRKRCYELENDGLLQLL